MRALVLQALEQVQGLELVPGPGEGGGGAVRTLNLTGNRLRSLAGLSAYPGLETLVLDKNGLSGLPECPCLPTVDRKSVV
jgi:hypothetical protein